MAGETSGAYFTANAVVDKTAAATFIPEIWSDEIIASYQKNLKMAPLVKKMTMKGKKGDLIHIPKPVRGAAFAKQEATAVTIQANLESELTININRHFEYSRLIEDIVEVQALSSLRRFYTEDAGYQLALRVDTDLFFAATGFGNGTLNLAPASADGSAWVNTATFYNDATNGLSAYAVDTVVDADPYSDTAFRGLIKKLDDNNVPMDNRVFVIPPALRSAIMGTDRYVSSDFRDSVAARVTYIFQQFAGTGNLVGEFMLLGHPRFAEAFGVGLEGEVAFHDRHAVNGGAEAVNLNGQRKAVEQLRAQVAFFRVHGSHKNEAGRVGKRDAFALYHVDAHRRRVQQQVYHVVIQQVDLVNVQ